MRNKPFPVFFILSTILVLLIPHLANSAALQSTLPYYGGQRVPPTSYKFIQLDITQIPSNAHVSVSLFGLNDTAPNVFVSLEDSNQTPNSTETADYFSTNSSGGIIFIPRQKLAKVQNIYLTLYCASEVIECRSALSVEYAQEFSVEPDGEKHIQSSNSLQMASTAVYRFQADFDKDVNRMVIHVGAVINHNRARSQLRVFLNRGNDIPYSGHSGEIVEIPWLEGSTIIITEDSPLFCRSCNYTMSLKFPRFTSLSVEIQTLTSEATLQDKALFDGVSKDSSNVYYTKVAEGKHDIYVDIQLEHGSLKASISCDSADESYGKYTIDKSKEIMLTEQGRSRCKSGVYYITVHGSEESVYTIQTTTKLVKKLAVGNGIPVESEIIPDETVNRQFYVPAGTSGKIIITLESSSLLEMNINTCKSLTDCKDLTSDNTKPIDSDSNKNKKKTDDFDFDLNKQGNKQIATIDMNDLSNCYPIFVRDPDLGDTAVPVCAYNLVLHSSQKSVVDYTLEIDVEGHQWLLAGIPQDGSVARNETVYFGFSTVGSDLGEVNIELTKFSGNVEVYVSRKEKYPTQKNSDVQSKNENAITFRNKSNLNGDYYIAVKGLEASSFSLKATALTKNGDSQNFVEVLTAGTPLKGEIHPKDGYPARFYEFFVDLNEDWDGSITVTATTSRNFVTFGVNNNGEVPLPFSSTWTTTNQSIVISSADRNFIRQGAYHIGVFTDYSKGRPQGNGEVEFSIVYFLNQTVVKVEDQDPIDLENPQHLFLSPSSPFNRSLKKDQVDYYEVFIMPRDNKLTLSKETTAGNVELFVSLDPNNQYPNEKAYNYSTKATNRNWIELNQNDLSQACKTQPSALCVMYVAVIPQGIASSYSISLKRSIKKTTRPESLTQLEDGKELSLSVPQDDSTPELFYFYTLPLEPSFITVNCPYKEAVIYANILGRDTDISSTANLDLPTSSSYKYQSEKERENYRTGNVNVTIPALSDETPQLVVLSVYFTEWPGTYYPTKNAKYSILLDSQMMPITLGTQYNGIVHHDQYRYFTLNIQDSQCTLLISAKSLDDQELTIVAAAPHHDDLPTLENSKFKPRKLYGSTFLEINREDLVSLSTDLNAYYDMYGKWVIGVYGEKSNEFSLITTCESQKMVELEADKTVGASFWPQSALYFLYKSSTKKPLSIRTKGMPSAATLYIRQASKDEDFISNLPSKTNYQWTSAADIDREACAGCLYLIALEGPKDYYYYDYSKFEITISESGKQVIDATQGNAITSRLAADASNIITLSHYPTEDLYIAISSKAEKLELYTSNSSAISTTNSYWNTVLAFNNQTQVLKIPREVNATSESSPYPNYYHYENISTYFLIKNPSSKKFNYTLTIFSLKMDIEDNFRYFSIGSTSSQAFSYNGTTENEVIEIGLDIDIYRSEFDSNDKSVASPKIGIKAYYWPVEGAGVPAINVPMSKMSVITQRGRDWYRMDDSTPLPGQLFKTDSKIGKFIFLITNAGNQSLTVTTRISTSTNEIKTLDKNSQISVALKAGKSQAYQTVLPGAGAWYLWAYSCRGVGTEVNIQNGTDADEVNITRTRPDFSHFYKATNGEGESTQIIRFGNFERGRDPADLGEFNLKSTFLPGRIAYDYEINREGFKESRIRTNQDNSIIYADVNPIGFTGYDPVQDTIFYELRACQFFDYNDLNLCNIGNCAIKKSKEFSIHMQDQMEMEVRVKQTGPYHVLVLAHIKSQGQEIKFIPVGGDRVMIKNLATQLEEPIDDNPEPIKREETENPVEEPSKETDESLNQPSSSSGGGLGAVGIILIVIVAVVVLGFFWYRCVKRSRGDYQEDTERGYAPPLLH